MGREWCGPRCYAMNTKGSDVLTVVTAPSRAAPRDRSIAGSHGRGRRKRSSCGDPAASPARADRDPVIEVNPQRDASRGDEGADRRRLIGLVDAINRLAKVE